MVHIFEVSAAFCIVDDSTYTAVSSKRAISDHPAKTGSEVISNKSSSKRRTSSVEQKARKALLRRMLLAALTTP